MSKPLDLVSKRIATKDLEEGKGGQQVEGSIEFSVNECSTYNVLLIGDSRSGKSTFIELLKNINFVVEPKIFSVTPAPSTHVVLINFKNKNLSVNLIDTPGVNEIGDSSRSNDTITHMISEFVKKDVTRLHLVLIAVNVLDADKVKSISEVIKVLGKNLSSNMALLITHSENRYKLEEDEWIQQFNSTKAFEFIKKACKAGFLFTGAIDSHTYKDVKIRDKFILSQKKKIVKFLDLLVSLPPQNLSNTVHAQMESKFSIKESFINNYNRLSKLCPEIKNLSDQIVLKRGQLNNMTIPDEYKGDVESIMAQCGDIGSNSIVLPTIGEDLIKIAKEHTEMQEKISKKVESASVLNDQFMNILNEINRLIDMINFN